MKFLPVSFIFLLMCAHENPTSAPAHGLPAAEVLAEESIVFFEGTLAEALAAAKKEKKLVFVDAYADWCRPCKQMESQVFTDGEVAEYFNEHFISLKLNIEKGEGVSFGQKNNIKFLPTFLFFSGSGKEISRVSGYKAPQPFIDAGKDAVDS